MIENAETGSSNLTAFRLPLEGIRLGKDQVNSAARELASGNLGPRPMVNLIEGSVIYKANGAALQAMNEMAGTLLDLRA